MNESARETFLTYRDILSRVADACLAAEGYLRKFRLDAKEPWQNMVEEIADVQHELARSIEAYLTDGSEEILSTRVQYEPEFEDREEPQSIGAALKWSTKTNDEIVELLDNIAGKFDARDIHDDLEELEDKVNAVGRKISMIRVTAEDV